MANGLVGSFVLVHQKEGLNRNHKVDLSQTAAADEDGEAAQCQFSAVGHNLA